MLLLLQPNHGQVAHMCTVWWQHSFKSNGQSNWQFVCIFLTSSELLSISDGARTGHVRANVLVKSYLLVVTLSQGCMNFLLLAINGFCSCVWYESDILRASVNHWQLYSNCHREKAFVLVVARQQGCQTLCPTHHIWPSALVSDIEALALWLKEICGILLIKSDSGNCFPAVSHFL